MTLSRLIGCTLVLAGCGGSDGMTPPGTSEYIAGFNPPAATAGELVVKSPVFPQIAAGADITLCSYLDQTIDGETDVVGFRAYQSASGHHVMLAAARRKQEVG